jgi:hypothetical protein
MQAKPFFFDADSSILLIGCKELNIDELHEDFFVLLKNPHSTMSIFASMSLFMIEQMAFSPNSQLLT